MTIQLELDAETEARLNALAAQQGVAPEQYASDFLRENVPPFSTGSGKLTMEEFHAMLKELQSGSENLPVLPTSAFSRESFYEDRA